ncbi:MAG: transposase [Selenomonadaceae bacterium]|nr:transposase [Selenomonadaceae bacterium]
MGQSYPKEVEIRKTKNDAVDAQIIADVVRFGRYCKTSVAPEVARTLQTTLLHC